MLVTWRIARKLHAVADRADSPAIVKRNELHSNAERAAKGGRGDIGPAAAKLHRIPAGRVVVILRRDDLPGIGEAKRPRLFARLIFDRRSSKDNELAGLGAVIGHGRDLGEHELSAA